ncbi:MAG: hypothetical protein K2L12_01860 [Clostridia bacterium]|nr:hypothetical protein [Clostridia bacterium]
MKRRKALITEIVKIIINCITVPLYFIKFFCDVAVLPGVNENGEEITGRFYHYYSIFDKIDREGMACLVWGAIVIISVSITLSVFSMIYNEKKDLKIASHTVFGVAIVLFLALLLTSAFIWYNY